MAKFARYDPRNKKMGRNKVKALEKDLRIKPTEKKVKDLENAHESAQRRSRCAHRFARKRRQAQAAPMSTKSASASSCDCQRGREVLMAAPAPIKRKDFCVSRVRFL